MPQDTKYKLTYFPICALAEPIRFLLAYGNLEFEDERFDRADWPTKYKPNTPFGKVPVLEINGKQTHQSGAICRYLARQLNLVGKSDQDSLEVDIIVDTISDFRAPLADYFYDPNPESKSAKLEPLKKNTLPFYLGRFDKIVGENGGYFVNNQLTWADLYWVALADYLQKMAGENFIQNYPNLKSHNEKITNIAQIKSWLARRPPSVWPF